MRKAYLASVLWSVLLAPAAQAQIGYYRAIEPPDAVTSTDKVKVMQPQPGWKPVLDITESDGTAQVPSCGQPNVIDSVKNGILQYWNGKFRSVTAGQFEMFSDVDMGTVWVHPALSGGFVCDATIKLLSSDHGADADNFIAPEPYKFETFAKDGQAYVFFLDINPQSQE